MILTCDIGNTNIVFGVFDGDELVFESRIDTNIARMADQYAVILMDVLDLYDCEKNSLTGAIISSVVPPVTRQLKSAIQKLCGFIPLVIEPGLKTGLNIKIDDPSTLGSDLACGAIAAKAHYQPPCIIIDMGTATKIMAIDKSGSLVGGVFYPGIRISLESLSKNTATLPLISADNVDADRKIIGTNTVDSMQNGILMGTACMLDGVIERFEKEIGKSTVVATGGYSEIIIPFCRREIHSFPHLILEGLKIVYEKNNKAKK